MKASISWHRDVSFLAESGSGHAMIVDGAPEHGGRNIGPRPMELILMGLGSCASFDVITILKKQRQDVASCECTLEAERADAVPSVFTKITINFQISGNNLDESKVERAVALSAETYCSVSKMLEEAGVGLSHRVTFV
ncbi:MAG: osmotically inducible protein C [Gammaproteobacteria bacterium]|nr:osmotically inducible protein C [Gammaproteobacteria bacterium]HAN81318.1 osmotically inducible protein C [Gammaproteobacteria bacterium]|tara:strand:- start:108 stop:521 length:414 start_codon:yes stop_codon:yes gene_type:complete